MVKSLRSDGLTTPMVGMVSETLVFKRGLDRFLLFTLQGMVGEAFDAETAIAMLNDPEHEPGPGSFKRLTPEADADR